MIKYTYRVRKIVFLWIDAPATHFIQVDKILKMVHSRSSVERGGLHDEVAARDGENGEEKGDGNADEEWAGSTAEWQAERANGAEERKQVRPQVRSAESACSAQGWGIHC